MDKFYRDRENRLFLGVLAGIAKKFDWDLSMLRIISAILLIFTNVPFITIYFIVALFTEER